MIKYSNTESLGNCVQNWEAFYEANYHWLYSTALEVTRNTVRAKEITERIMVHLVLSHPEIIIDNNVAECRKFVAVMFPYLGLSADRTKELSAGRLLNVYYNPN